MMKICLYQRERRPPKIAVLYKIMMHTAMKISIFWLKIKGQTVEKK